MSERLSARLERLSLEAEALVKIATTERDKHDTAEFLGPWLRWNTVYWWVDGIMADADEARQFLREQPDMDLDL